MRLIPFHLGKAVLEKDPAHDLPLQPGDVVTIFGSKERWSRKTEHADKWKSCSDGRG
jgi:hypothetical protein